MALFPKLTLVILTLLGGTIASLSVSYYWTERQSLQEQSRVERETLLQNLAHITREALVSGDDLLLVKYTRWLKQWNAYLLHVSVWDSSGEVLAHSEPEHIGTQAMPTSPEPQNQSVLLLSEPVQLGGRWAATVSAGFSQLALQDALDRQLRQIQWRIALIAAIAFGSGIVIAFWITHSWTKPIATLAEAARQVGRGFYKPSLYAISKRRDELGFLARSFEAMTHELETLERMKDDFISAVTHELRSPLGAIESYLNLMKEEHAEHKLSPTWMTYFDRLHANTQRLTHFVNDLLDVAALERGAITLHLQPVDLSLLVQDVAALFAPKMNEKNIAWLIHQPNEPLPHAQADPERIRQVLVNLLANAIKFTPSAGTIQLGIEFVSCPATWRISVKDSGVGIAAEDQERIFKKFEQIASAREHVKGPKGTGLGLAICKDIVERHGGTLRVESRLREGSCFSFTLPAVLGAPLEASR